MIKLGGLMGDGFKLGKMDVKYGQVVSNPFVRAFAPKVNEGEDNGVQSHEKEGGDHEVHMAHNQLDTIIKAAYELRKKLGDNEKDIPAWIQDHISNAENYITQASSGYYEYKGEGAVNEGRGVKSLAKELFAVAEHIQGYVEVYKKKKGTPDEKKIVDILKKLNAEKKVLQQRMDDEVASLYKDVELKIQD
jgi:hypothetical protein